MALCSMVFSTVPAYSAQPENQSALLKRQLNSCMVRRMGTDKTLSYNDAMRVCKERSQQAKPALASVTPSDAGAKSH